MPLYLTEEDVDSLLTMEDAIESVEQGFMAMSRGEASNLPRQRLQLPRGTFNMMSAVAPALGVMGLKAYTTGRGYAGFHIQISNTANGELLAIIEGAKLGQLRTGAASGVATKYMARDDASSVGIIGTGKQAISQLESVCNVRSISTINVFSRTVERRERFASLMSSRLGMTVSAVKDPQLCVSGCDIVIAVTTSANPVFDGSWIDKGTHINAVGSNASWRRELDEETIQRSDFVVVDDIQQAGTECGDILYAIEQGVIRWEQIRTLTEVVGGAIKGRASMSDITLFESQGIALEDIALGIRAFQIARKREIGTEF